MKLLTILGLVLGSVLALGGQTARTQEPREGSAISQKTKRLELSIATDRHKYRRHGKIKLTAMLTNTDYVKDIVVYGTLGWGYLSSFTYTIRDASGKRIEPTILADEITFPIPRNDASAFVKLRPDQFIGVRYIETLDRLGLRKPGKYSIFVEYHCPISTTDVSLKEFWSKEDGILRSNRVWIEVVR